MVDNPAPPSQTPDAGPQSWRTFAFTTGAAAVVLLLLAGAVAFVRWAGRAPVEACTILYVGVDEQVHLTNEAGSVDLELPGPKADGEVWHSFAPPAWSPSGRFVGYMHSASDAEKYLVVVDPLRGERWLHRTNANGRFGGWGGDETLYECHVGFRDRRTGELLRPVDPPDGSANHLSPYGDDGYVAVGPAGVHLRDWGFKLVGSVHAQHGAGVPKTDPTGEWVGWTVGVRQDQSIAVCRTSDSPYSSPQLLGQQFAAAVMCDWTDDGNILANVMEGTRVVSPAPRAPWRLVVLDRDGKLLREVHTDVPPLAGSPASIRRKPPAR